MQSRDQTGAASNRRRFQIWRVTICWALTLTAVLAWSLPGQKDDAVFGYLSYAQFWFAILMTLFAGSAGLVCFVPEALRRAVGFRLAAAWLGALLAVGLAEGVSWLLPVRHPMDNPWYFTPSGKLTDSTELPFERPPNLRWQGMSHGDLALLNGDKDPYARPVVFETDRHGFRNREEILQAELLVIGDSFTEAGNVFEPETFPQLIGRELGVTVRNLGRAGYSPPEELIVLRKYGLPCKPKVVVWQLAESNDLDGALRFQEWVAAGRPRYFDLDKNRELQKVQAWQQRSPTYAAFEWLRVKQPSPWPYDGVFRDRTGNERPMRFLNCVDPGRSVSDHPGWPALTEALVAGAALCRSNQIQLVVVCVPTKYRVYGQFTQMLKGKRRAVWSSSDESFGSLVRELCLKLEVEFVDLTPSLEAEARAGELVYEPYDTHFSPRGHGVVAREIAHRLRQLHGMKNTMSGTPSLGSN